MIKIGIIGGSGLEDPQILQNPKEIEVTTKYGNPSSALICGQIEGVEVVIISRHGKDHSIMPTNVPNQANIWALKEQGVTHILATTACGSLKEYIKPGDFVFTDQFIDRTTKRKSTFYEKGKVCHIPMADPFCTKLRAILKNTANIMQMPNHEKGIVVTIEGPRFSTKAESHMFRAWGADVINMSTAPEAVLAREAGICYASIAMSTDYDCWHESEESVTFEMVMARMKKNSENAKKLIIKTLPAIRFSECSCKEAIKTSVMGGEPEHPQEPVENTPIESSKIEKNNRMEEPNIIAGTRKEEETAIFKKMEQHFTDIKKIRDELIEEPPLDEETEPKTKEIDLKSKVRSFPNWPKPGVIFRDVTTLLKDPEGFQETIRRFVDHYKNQKIDSIVGIESRGFIIAGVLAKELGVGFIPVRKPGKLPGESEGIDYSLEYGTDRVEVHKDSIKPGDRILVIDDLIATGGTVSATCQLIERLGGRVAGCGFIIDLPDLKGKEKISQYPIFTLMEFEGE